MSQKTYVDILNEALDGEIGCSKIRAAQEFLKIPRGGDQDLPKQEYLDQILHKVVKQAGKQ